MDFGEALQRLREGKAVARRGWNGQGMWLMLVPGSSITVEADRPLGAAAPHLVGEQITYRPHIDMKTVDGEIVPWIASQSDILGADWFVA